MKEEESSDGRSIEGSGQSKYGRGRGRGSARGRGHSGTDWAGALHFELDSGNNDSADPWGGVGPGLDDKRSPNGERDHHRRRMLSPLAKRGSFYDQNNQAELISRGICKFWHTPKGCSRGRTCKYKHLTSSQQESNQWLQDELRNDRERRDRYSGDFRDQRSRYREPDHFRGSIYRNEVYVPYRDRSRSRSRRGRDSKKRKYAAAELEFERPGYFSRSRKRSSSRSRKRSWSRSRSRSRNRKPPPPPHDDTSDGNGRKTSPKEDQKEETRPTAPRNSTNGDAPSPSLAGTNLSISEFLNTVKKEAGTDTSSDSSGKETSGNDTSPKAAIPEFYHQNLDSKIGGSESRPLGATMGIPSTISSTISPIAPVAMGPSDMTLYPAYMQACEKMKELLNDCEGLRQAKERLEKENAELRTQATLSNAEREKLRSLRAQVDELLEQNRTLSAKNSELEEQYQDLTRSSGHTKKNNADLRKHNERLREEIADLSATIKRKDSKSRSAKQEREHSKERSDSRSKPGRRQKITAEEVKSEEAPSAPTQQALPNQQTAAKIAELENAVIEHLCKNMDLVRKNIDLLKRLKEAEVQNMNLQKALAEYTMVQEPRNGVSENMETNNGNQQNT